MLLSRKTKQTIAIIGCFVLVSCGFQPLHTVQDPKVNNQTALVGNNIEISNIPNRSGQYLRNVLIDNMYLSGYPQNARYRLDVSKLSENITRLGVRRDASSTRAQMKISADIKLYDKHLGQTVLNRSFRTTNSFNILDSQYSTRVSEQYARDRALEDIAKQITTEMALFSHRRAAE
jgi:LPS-assembly lipoprotein